MKLALALAAAKADDCNPNDRVCPECVPEEEDCILLSSLVRRTAALARRFPRAPARGLRFG